MGQPAARILDLHTCPMVTVLVPHVGGPITGPPTAPNVLICSQPAAVMTNMCTCVGPPDMILQGSFTVLIGSMPAARVGDMTLHGGIIVGMNNVLIGGSGMSLTGTFDAAMADINNLLAQKKLALLAGKFDLANKLQEDADKLMKAIADKAQQMVKDAVELTKTINDAKVLLESKKNELDRWSDSDKANVKTWMGDSSEETREMLQGRIDTQLKTLDSMTTDNFKPIPDDYAKEHPNTYAYVYPDDKSHTVYIGQPFKDAKPTGTDSKAGTLIHETSHFDDVAGTKDVVYGTEKSKQLAKKKPSKAKKNADSYEYYIEH